MLSEIKRRAFQVWQKLPWPALILAGAFAVYGWLFVASFALPRHTEWETLRLFEKNGSAFPMTANGWPVLSHLISHLFYLCGGWNIRAYLALNYLLYIADMVLLYRLIVKSAGAYRYLPLFFIPFFSDLNALNLMQTTALPVHLTVFFGLMAVEAGFHWQPSYKNSLLFLLFLILSVFSMNGIFAFGLFIGWAVMLLTRRNWQMVLGAALLLSIPFIISTAYIDGSFFADFTQLFRKAVITCSAVLSGFDIETDFHFILILPVIGTLGYVLFQKRLWRDSDALALYSVLLAVFLSVFCMMNAPVQFPFLFINAGAGFAVFMIPIVLTLLRVRRFIFIYSCFLCVLGYSAGFSYRVFRIENDFRQTTVQCAEEYFRGDKQSEACQVLQDPYLPAVLDRAKALNLNYFRTHVKK